ncbi:MAG: sigma 54-interacting transcriptional regulator [Bdellovibrionota bacterium]
MDKLNKSRNTVLLVDDDLGLLRLLAMRIEASGYNVITASSGEEALNKIIIENPDVVVSDLKMNHMDGLSLLKKAQKTFICLPFIIITAHGTIPDAVQATQLGSYSFLSKPIDTKLLLDTIKNAIQLNSPKANDKDFDNETSIITRNHRMLELIKRGKKIANSNLAVLILGPCGVGKEVFARMIHSQSDRSNKPFVAINCGAIPENLLESELYGYKKGAFSGADRDYQGLFRAANGGTLFLDEIGDMPLSLQVKLLRVLQEKKVRALGSTVQYDLDFRIVSATNVNLEEAVINKEFREDLFYRINIVSFDIPALNERRDDISILIEHFLSQALTSQNSSKKKFSPEAIEYLKNKNWPGNVRHLKNTVEQLVALCSGEIISLGFIEQVLSNNEFTYPSLKEAKDDFERAYLLKVLAAEDGNVSKAARVSGRNRTDFYKLISKHHICLDSFKNSAIF